MQQGGFVDLRLNRVDADEQGFWPTFTDIMMVIVLIFLLAMLTLLVKNMGLVDQLRASLVSERAATAQAQSFTDKNNQLHSRLNRLEEEAAMLRMRLMDLGEEHSHTLSRLDQSEKDNVQLKSALSSVTQARDVSLDAQTELEQRQAVLEQQKTALEKSNADLQQRKLALLSKLSQRDQDIAEQQHQQRLSILAMSELKLQNETQIERLKRLELEYAGLESKYKRLIRPARSSLGKVVVFVRYQKQDGKLNIALKSANDAQYVPVDGTGLHQRLASLQKKYGKKLYVRIVFPDDSGLSYTEAWNLTESLLRLYDYYYQQ